MRTRTALALAVLVCAAVACARRERYVPPPDAELVVVPVGTARPATSTAVVFAELAADDASRARGLSMRASVGPGEGMLFVYDRPDKRRFWMKDCLVGLDIAFLADDGRVLSLATLPRGFGLPEKEIPFTESPSPVRYVLETAAGWLASQGVGVGDQVDFSRALPGGEER